MRMWMVNPSCLCRKHLLGEHRELHCFLGTLKKGISIQGYINNGLLELHNLKNRHNELVLEFEKRGYCHKSFLNLQGIDLYEKGYVDIEKNLKELSGRCVECQRRIENDQC